MYHGIHTHFSLQCREWQRVEGGGWRMKGGGRSGEQIRERRGKKGEKGIEYYMGEGEGRR